MECGRVCHRCDRDITVNVKDFGIRVPPNIGRRTHDKGILRSAGGVLHCEPLIELYRRIEIPDFVGGRSRGHNLGKICGMNATESVPASNHLYHLRLIEADTRKLVLEGEGRVLRKWDSDWACFGRIDSSRLDSNGWSCARAYGRVHTQCNDIRHR